MLQSVKGPAIVDNSPGEKVSIVSGMETGLPQPSSPTTLWKLAYIDGDVLPIFSYAGFTSTILVENLQCKIIEYDSTHRALILSYSRLND